MAELGNDQKTIETENINSKLSGSYIKTGFNYNLYNNLPGLNNEIYVGLRYSQSLFKNELIDYSIYNKDRFWNDQRILEYKEFDNLKSSWIEFVVGFNSEIKNNLFMGLSLRLNRMLKQDIPENFTNLFFKLILVINNEVKMFQAIISICNLINMECVILKDKIGLINTQKECAVRAEIMKKDFIDLYKGPVIIEKNCIKINKYKSI